MAKKKYTEEELKKLSIEELQFISMDNDSDLTSRNSFSIYNIEVVSNGGQTEYICSLGSGDFDNSSEAYAVDFYLEQNSDLNLGFRIITSGIWENIYDDYVFPFTDDSGFYKVKFRSLPAGAFDTNGEYGPLFLEFIVVDMAQYEPATQIDINGLVDFSYAGYKYGKDIPNRQCTVKVDIHPESLEVPLENPTIPGVCNWEVSVDDETPIEVNCPDISTKLQQIINDNPGEVICLPEGLFKVENDITIETNSTVLRGDSGGTYLYFKSVDIDTLKLYQHFAGDCSNYNDLVDMCDEVPGCFREGGDCKNTTEDIFSKLHIIGKSEDFASVEVDNGKIVEDAPFGSNTIIVDSIYTLGEEIKCGDEITIKFEMTQDFINEYNMSDVNISEEDDSNIFPNDKYAQQMDTWQLGKTHRMFRRRVTKPPEPIETSIEDDGNVPTSIIADEDGVRSGGRRRQPKVLSWKLTLDVPLRHDIKTTYNPTIKHRTEPFVTEVGVEDLFISNAIPYEYSQKKFKPYKQENFISNGPVVNVNNAKNCWIKNVNSFSPTDFNLQGATSGISLMQYLYKITWEAEIGIPSALNIPMKNYFTNLFCATAKARTTLLGEDDQQYWWGRRLCNFAYNQSIWPELWGRPNQTYWYFPSSKPGEPCKVHDHPLHSTQFGSVPGEGLGWMQSVSGYPPPQWTEPIDSVKMLGDLPDSVAEVKFSEGFPFGFHHYWFPHHNIPNNVDLSEYGWQVRFVNTINHTEVGDWHNCGWKNNEEYCHTYTFFGIDLNQNTMLITNNTMSDSDGGGLPADAIGIEGMGVQLSLGGITDCSGKCVPKKLIGTHGVDEQFQSVNFCGIDPNPYPFVDEETGESFPDYSFDSSCCICERMADTEFFPISYCDAPLWLGDADDLNDSEPVWLRKILYNYFPENNYDETIEPIYDPPEYSAIKEFNEFFDSIGNPTNVPSMEEEPKHLRSSGFSISNSRNVTIKDCTLKLPQSKGGGGNGYLFNITAGNNDILIEDCEGYRGRHNFLSGGSFSNSGIVHNRVKSSGGWLWLNESANLLDNPQQELTDDEWWSRYKQLEITPGLGKPGFSDNHVGLTFGSLYTDSEIFDGIAWHNRLDNSNGAGITTVNSVLWNLKGHDGVANPSYENSSIPGMGMIQSYGARNGLIFHGTGALSQNNLNYMYDVHTETDEEISTYLDYLNDLFGVGAFDDSFSQTIGLFTLFGNILIESLLRDGLAIRFNNPNGEEIGGPVDLYQLDLKLDSNSDINLDFNDATNRYTIEVLNKGLSGQAQVGVGPIVYTFDVTSSGSLRIVLNLDTLELEEVNVNIVDYDVEIPGGWFPFKNFIEEVLIEWLAIEVLGDIDSIISNASIEEKIKNVFKTEVPIRLKEYTIGSEDFDVYDELENSDITEASGLVHSRQNDDIFWTHNDFDESGVANSNTIYAFNQDGLNIGEWTLTNLPMNQRDWEDIATDNNGNLYIGEIGDNGRNYGTKFIYKCPEPDLSNLGSMGIQCTSYEFKYNDTIKHDAETLMVDLNGDIYIITKHPIGTSGKSKVFKLGVDTISNTEINEAELIMELDTFPGDSNRNQVTGGDISSNGSKILVLTYEKMFYYERLSSETIQDALSKEPEEVTYNKEHPLEQGEAVAWSNNNNNYYTISEKKIPLNPIMKYVKETVSGFVNFYFGDYRQGTSPNDTYYLQPDIWDNDFPNYPSLYDIQKEIRLDLPISEDLTLPMCNNDIPGEITPEEDIPILVSGCTDSSACNYNPSANRDDGSCTYPTDYPHRCYVDLDGDGDYETPRMVYWCDRIESTIEEVDNFPSVQGVVEYYQSCEDYPGDYVSEENRGIIYGCTDFTSCNYMPGATEDDGSCDYGIDYSGYDSTFGYNCSHVNFIKDFIFSGNDEFYFMGNFQRFTFEHWNACYDIVNLCLSWTDNGDLRRIVLNNQPMQGFIPESIGYVNTLEKIHLMNLAMQHNGRNGTFNADLPASIGSLTNLEILRLPGNRFGTLYSQGIPDEIGRLVNLEQLDMQPPPGSNFGLRGTIPQSMENLTNLKTLSLQRNKLEGEIPDIFGDMFNLYRFRAQDNQLEGYFPPSICNTLAADGVDDEGNSVDNSIFVADNYLCEPPPPDCLTGDEIQFDRQYFNESCYEIEIPPIIEIDP